MPLSKLVFKPGINREGTNYSNEGGWHDGDKIRFRYGYVEKLGGWEKVNQSALDGTPRGIHDFTTLASQDFLFVGTEKKAYLEESGTLYDITPYRRTVWLPFEVTGVDAGGFVGTVTVQLGLPFEDGVLEVTGVSATAELGILEAVTTQTFTETAVQMTGEVGTVTWLDYDNRNVTVDVRSYSAEDSIHITEYTQPIVSSVGTVTVSVS